MRIDFKKDLNLYRILLCIGVFLVLCWWFAVSQTHGYKENILFRIILCILAMSLFFSTFFSHFVRKRISDFYFVIILLLTAHSYYILIINNNYSSPYIVTLFIVLFVGSTTLTKWKHLLLYFIFSGILSIIVFKNADAGISGMLLIGFAGIIIISLYILKVKENILFFQKLLEEQEKEDYKEQIVKAAKLAAIGSLLTSIAHELKSPIMVIRMTIEVLKEQIGKQESHKKCVEHIERLEIATDKAEHIIKALRTYGRDDVNEKMQVSIIPVVDEIIFLVEDIYKKENIELIKEYSNQHAKAFVNVGKIQQIVLNLLSNAHDAVEKNTQAKSIKIRIDDNSDYTLIQISDNGCGIPRENMDKIFNLNFTTKPMDKGTGLGLAICKYLAESMNGVLTVDSEINRGSIFSLKFPKTTEQQII